MLIGNQDPNIKKNNMNIRENIFVFGCQFRYVHFYIRLLHPMFTSIYDVLIYMSTMFTLFVSVSYQHSCPSTFLSISNLYFYLLLSVYLHPRYYNRLQNYLWIYFYRQLNPWFISVKNI